MLAIVIGHLLDNKRILGGKQKMAYNVFIIPQQQQFSF